MSYNKYSKEQKEKILSRILSGEESISDIHKETGINANTLYRWRDEVKRTGLSSTTKYKKAENWSTQDKFLVVLETANLSEIEFSEYCRKKGIYPEQVKEWKDACMQANGGTSERTSKVNQELRKEKKEKEKLQKELDRKEKALAEAAALLVLGKKANAIWGTDNEED